MGTPSVNECNQDFATVKVGLNWNPSLLLAVWALTVPLLALLSLIGYVNTVAS